MAQFRRNHQPQGGKGGNLIRVGLFAAVLGGLFTFYNTFMGGDPAPAADPEQVVTPLDRADDQDFYLPSSTTRQVIEHQYYTLSYSEKDEQAEWVAYVLTRERLAQPWVDRPDQFEADPAIKSGSAQWWDYRNSGYDRGHLVPAADMAFSTTAIQETFLMSNISPQSRDFNKGIWKELEELTRDWAKKFKKLYVVTGPLLRDGGKGKIKGTKITIPTAYFKVLLDLAEPEQKGIAFIVPNAVSYEPLYKYAVSIDEVEARTKINFFPKLMDPSLEAEMESSFNLDLWPFSKKKFDLRVERWNTEE